MLRRQSVLAQVAAITLLFAAEHARAANPSSRIDPAERALVAATRAGAEAQCDCAATSTHRAYLRCVSHAAKTLAAGRRSKGGLHGAGRCAPDPCGNLETTTTSTVPPLCGNRVIDPGEECDPPWSRTCPARGPGHINRECQDNCRCPTTPTNTCPANPAGGPDEIEFVVASQGADLDVGW